MRVLHAIHGYLPRHRAGSELYAHALVRAQQARHEVRVLCAERDGASPHGTLRARRYEGVEVTEIVNNRALASLDETWRPAALEAPLSRALEDFRPDVLHVHSLLNLSFELPALARRQGAAVVGTLHDYALVCPSGGQRVHVAEEHVCRTIDPVRCARCFDMLPVRQPLGWTGPGASLLRLAARGLGRPSGAGPPRPEDVTSRLEAARRVLESFDVLVAPSLSLAAEYRGLGAPAARLRVSDYGFPALAPLVRPPRGPRLRIGFVGTPVWHKGVHVLLEALRRLPEGRFNLDVWGDLTVAPGYVRGLRRRAAGLPVRFQGVFERDQVPAVYAGIDVLVVPSLWLENSPLVVHEAFLAGVPVVAARIGGLVDLVEDGKSGLLCEAGDAAALAAALRRLMEEPGLLERLAAARPPVKPIERDVREWDAAYQDARTRRRAEGDA
jgi:glycosyltransferase involved in cell wall biosynthesis